MIRLLCSSHRLDNSRLSNGDLHRRSRFCDDKVIDQAVGNLLGFLLLFRLLKRGEGTSRERTPMWLFNSLWKVAATRLSVDASCRSRQGNSVRPQQLDAGSSAAVEALSHICILVFLWQIRVAANVDSFGPEYLHSSNSHFGVVYPLRTRCVKVISV